MTIENTLREFVGAAIRADGQNLPVKKLKGDASNRSYYRVGAAPSWVVMVMPLDATKSEEKTAGEPPKELPFVNVHRYLKGLGVRLPAILKYAPEQGLMILEDLGDVTFEQAQSQSAEAREKYYGRAIDLLAQLRARAEKARDEDCLAFTRAFDTTLYDWELHHFREYGLEARYGVTPTPDERARMDALFLDVAKRLDAEPKGFTHRDYQSRNLMVKGDELVVIDFQDALQGPRQYDLVALLRDSYVQLDRPFIEKMLDRYLA
ncbi:MAG: aminoglycoside phosphotransferase family protein, partial [Myxococcales bacterium]